MPEICEYGKKDLAALMFNWDVSFDYFGLTNLIEQNLYKFFSLSSVKDSSYRRKRQGVNWQI